MSCDVAVRGSFAFIDESLTWTVGREPLDANQKMAVAGRDVAFLGALARFADHDAPSTLHPI